MLKGIDPLLHADLLHVLHAMGHRDELAIINASFRRRAWAGASSTRTA